MSEKEPVKVAFVLEPDEDGYPPYSVEHLWAAPMGGDRFKIENIPFYVQGIACEDIVTARAENDGLVFEALAEASGHSTLRVLVYEPSEVQGLRDHLRRLGCDTELSDVEGLVAVDVPPEVSFSSVVDFLASQQDRWDYEEGALGH